jgi:pyruvate,water dikinase
MNELAESSPELGNKIKNLAVLARVGERVPRGFGLPYDVYTNHVASLIPELQQARIEAYNYTDMAKRFHEIMLSTPFKGATEVMDALKIHMPGALYFAVRSSGAPIINSHEASEDSVEMSLAGQYESFLLVPACYVPWVILLCYASLFSERCLRQFNVREDICYLNSRMSVLIQEMCQADISAVVMTRDPVEGGDNFGIEVTYGACEALVSGKVQGDFYLLSRATGTITNMQLGTKTTRIGYMPFFDMKLDNKVTYPVPNEFRAHYAASHELIGEIYSMSMRIEKYFNVPQDIELVVANGNIIIVQTRPITATK